MMKPNPVMIALRRAAGGGVGTPPWYTRNAARMMERSSGWLSSPVPGRTDRLALNARAGSYVIPADVVSGIGQGNTHAGVANLDRMFKSGPYGAAIPRLPRGHMPRPPRPPRFAAGGHVPIMAAGGEYIIEPDAIMRQFGNIEFGHKVLDKFVNDARQQTIKDMQRLPGPSR